MKGQKVKFCAEFWNAPCLCVLCVWVWIPDTMYIHIYICSLMFFTHHAILFLQFSQAQISLSHLSSATSCFPPQPSFSVFGCASVCLLVVPGRVKRLHYLDTLLMHAALWQTRAYPCAHRHKAPDTRSHNKNIRTLIKSNTLLRKAHAYTVARSMCLYLFVNVSGWKGEKGGNACTRACSFFLFCFFTAEKQQLIPGKNLCKENMRPCLKQLKWSKFWKQHAELKSTVSSLNWGRELKAQRSWKKQSIFKNN